LADYHSMAFRLSRLHPVFVVVGDSEAMFETVAVAAVESAEKSAVADRNRAATEQTRAVAEQTRAVADHRLTERKQAVDKPVEDTRAGGEQVVNADVTKTKAASSGVPWNSRLKIDHGNQLQRIPQKFRRIRSRQQPVTVCENYESWQGLLKIVSNQIIWEFP
jgi:hypothetical protein